jgi:uncharacterized protein (TIGR02246 family)
MSAATPDELPVRFAAAINGRDLAGALELWSERAQLLTAHGETLDGRQAIAPVLGALIESGTTIEITTTSLHRAGDVAIAAGALTMTAADGHPICTEALAVYARTPAGTWQIAIDAPWGLRPAEPAAGAHQASPARESHVSSASGSSGIPASST